MKIYGASSDEKVVKLTLIFVFMECTKIIIKCVLWHMHESKFTKGTQEFNPYIVFVGLYILNTTTDKWLTFSKQYFQI